MRRRDEGGGERGGGAGRGGERGEQKQRDGNKMKKEERRKEEMRIGGMRGEGQKWRRENETRGREKGEHQEPKDIKQYIL